MQEQSSLFNSMDTKHAPTDRVAEPDAAAKSLGSPEQSVKPIKSHARLSSQEDAYQKLVLGLKEYFEKNHFKRGVIGVSGGVDSALTLKIAVDALGAKNVTAILMPELGLTRQENIDHAKILCEFLGVEYHFQPINNFLRDFAVSPWQPGTLAQMNHKARIRAVLLYSFANTENTLVLGTSNKSELLLGYGTKFGDLAADVEVIGSLFKTEVIKLADHIGLPPEIVNKTPSAELTHDQTDEEEIGATYQDIDKVLMKLDLGMTGCIEHGLPATLVQLVFRRVEENEHKTKPPFVIKVVPR